MASGWRLRRPALPTLGEAAASGFVGSVRGIAPLSCLLLLGLLLQLPLARAAPLALQAWATAEVLFLGWYRFHLAQLQPPAIGPPMTKAQRQQAFARALAATSDLRRFVSGWFKLAPFSAIRTGNAKEWLAWAVFGSRLEALGAAEQQEVVGMLGAFEAALGAKLPAGYNPSLREGCIRINLDPISAQHRPVISYVVTYTAHAVGWALLRRQGFRRSRCGALSYWHRPASEPAAEPSRPIVLLHGIGLGLVPYLGLLDRLITAHGAACPILLPEFPHISQKIGGPPPPAPETCRAIRAMLCRHCPASRPDASGDPQPRPACFVGHSFGSIVCSWLVRLQPDCVASLLFLDPVTLMLQARPIPTQRLSRLSCPNPTLTNDCAGRSRTWPTTFSTARRPTRCSQSSSTSSRRRSASPIPCTGISGGTKTCSGSRTCRRGCGSRSGSRCCWPGTTTS